MYVTTELVGLIAATIALGTLLYATMRGLRKDVRSEIAHARGEMGALREEMKAGHSALREEMRTGDNALREEIGALRQEMKTSDSALREDIGGLRDQMQAGDASLRQEMLAAHASLRVDMQGGLASLRQETQAGFKELNTRVGTVEHRLAKVEGIIEGLFWSTRNQPPDSPREGVA